MKKTVKFLLTGILAFTSLGLVSVNIKDVKNGFVESTNDIAGEKINVGKKNAKSTTTTDDFVVGASKIITNAVAQRRVDDKGTTVRFVAAAKAKSLADGIIGGDLGFHVRYNRSETEVVNKYVAVESVYKSMVAGDTTYTNEKMGEFLVSTGLGEASNPNGYDVFITYSISEIPSTHLNTEFEVQPFFMETGGGTREFAPGTKKANATGYTLKVGNGNAVSLKDATDEKSETDTWANQYKAEGLTVKAGDKLVFAVDGKEVKPGASGEKNNATYNMGTQEVSIVNDATNVTIYLKVFDDGGYDIWVTGYKDQGDTPIVEGFEATVNGAKVTVGELEKGVTDLYACTVDLKKDDVLVITRDGIALKVGETASTEFKCTIAGVHKVYVNDKGQVWVMEPLAPVGTVYTVKVNGADKAITLIPDAENHAQFKLTLTKGDKVTVYGDGKALTGGAYSGTEYVVKATGEHTFYVNKEDIVYLDAPAVDPGDVTTITLSVDFSKITNGDERYAAYLFGGPDNEWISLEVNNGVATLTLTEVQAAKYTNIIFCRMNGATTKNNWSNKWNQTDDLTIDGNDGKTYKITGYVSNTDKMKGSWN